MVFKLFKVYSAHTEDGSSKWVPYGGLGFANQVLGGELDLETALTGTDVDEGEIQTGGVDVGGEMLLHSDGGTASTDIARQRE